MNKAKWFIFVVCWQVIGFIVTVILSVPAGNFHHFVHELLFCLTFTNMIGLAAVLIFLSYTKWLYRTLLPPILQYLLIAILLASAVWAAIKFSMWSGTYICGLDDYQVNRWHLVTIIVDCMVMALLTLFAILLALYERLANNLEKKIRENAKLQRIQLETKLALLQSKINPHFLFNTLNSMLDTLKTNPAQVEMLILNLSDIYRKTLNMPENSLVALQDELTLVQEYLQIEKVRMGERLQFYFSVDADLTSLKIPPMLLQILVENAIKHGLTPKKNGGTIHINIFKQAEQILLQVMDDGLGLQAQSNSQGFGLYSIHQRLKLMYKQAELHVLNRESGGVCAEVRLPYAV